MLATCGRGQRGDGLKLSPHRFQRVDQTAGVNTFPTQAVNRQFAFHVHQAHGKAELLLHQHASQLRTIHVGGNHAQPDGFADSMEVLGKQLNIAAKNRHSHSAKALFPFGSAAGMRGDEILIGLGKKPLHGAVTLRGERFLEDIGRREVLISYRQHLCEQDREACNKQDQTADRRYDHNLHVVPPTYTDSIRFAGERHNIDIGSTAGVDPE